MAEAISDFDELQAQIDSRMVSIDQRTVEVNSRNQLSPSTPQPTTFAAVLMDEGVEATPEQPPNAPPATAFVSVGDSDSSKETGAAANASVPETLKDNETNV